MGGILEGELLFPFLASIFYFNVCSSVVEPECSDHKFRSKLAAALFDHHPRLSFFKILDYEEMFELTPPFGLLQILAVVDHF